MKHVNKQTNKKVLHFITRIQTKIILKSKAPIITVYELKINFHQQFTVSLERVVPRFINSKDDWKSENKI